MELLYTTKLPRSNVRAVAWSGMNMVALSTSVNVKGIVSEKYKNATTHQLLIFDPNRPWDFHTISGECKSVVKELDWSCDGTKLLSLSEAGVVHVWRMKTNCLNNWVVAHKQEPPPDSNIIHAAWLDWRPMATINHSKEDWNEAMEFQPSSPHLRMLLGESFITVSAEGKVLICSTSLPHSEVGGDLKVDATLPGMGTITIAKTFLTQTGSILVGAGYQGGVVKVFYLTVELQWSSQVTLTANLATELNVFGKSDKISSLLMLPHVDGCFIHVCHNGTQLYQWSVKDITRSGSYQSRREGTHSSEHPIVGLAGSGLCLGSHDLSLQDQKMSEILVFEDVDMKEGEGKWPVEVLVGVAEEGSLMVLNRDSNKLVLSENLPPVGEVMSAGKIAMKPPAAKRQRLDEGTDEDSTPSLVCLSPNACCVLVSLGDTLYIYQMAAVILGLKDSASPEASHVSRLFSLAVMSSLSTWDLAVSCARLQYTHEVSRVGPAESKEESEGVGLVRKVLEHFSTSYELHSSSAKDLCVRQFFSACSFLHGCMEKGLLPSLSYRSTSRLYATSRLVELTLNPSSHELGLPRLHAVCTDNKMEENLNNLAEDLAPAEFAIPPEKVSYLQPHAHWLLELAIQIVAAIAEGQAHVNELLGRSVDDVVMDTEDASSGSDENPSPSLLDLLRELLLLICVWNKSLPQPMVPVSNGALALLFKVLTVFNVSPHSPLSEELQSEVKSNLPPYQQPNLLTLTRASLLQGFVCGLCSTELPECFERGVPGPLRPHVQHHYTSPDPFSPLALVVPRGMAPPWRDCFVEGQRDLLHGGTISSSVVMGAKLKQCSRCRSWTLPSEKLADQTPHTDSSTSRSLSPSLSSSQPVQQWRSAWTTFCLCGGPWTSQTP